MKRLVSWGEIRLALRLIVKQPVLSATIILALATGICLATMGFTFRDELLYSALPYRDGERFVRIFDFDREGRRLDPSLDRYQRLRDRATSFEHVGAVGGRPFTVEHGVGEVESISGAVITPQSLKWIDASPIAGRALIPSDGDPGAEPVVIIRESLWRRRYSSDPNIIGRALTIGGQPRIVVGVMPNWFEFPNSGELWLPLEDVSLTSDEKASRSELRIFGVLKSGVSLTTANAEVAALYSQMSSASSESIHPRVTRFTGDSDDAYLVMSSLVSVLVMVLLVVASNVATLVFARTWARAPELAVRTALGAGRARVVTQLFFETLLLGSMAAAVGMTAALASLRYIKASFEGWPFWITLEPNPRIVAFVIFLTLLVSVVSGLLPALRVTRHDLRNSLHAGRGFAFGGFGKAGAFLLVVEIALSVALLNGAVTMARAFKSHLDDIPALPKNQVLTAQLGRIPASDDRDKVVEAARSLPGVIAAGAGQTLPRLYPAPRLVTLEAIGDEVATAPRPAPGHAVGEGFLEAIGGTALMGRLFTANDFLAGAAPVVIVNEPFVRKFLLGRNPIGRRIRINKEARPGDDASPWREIVGVVPDLGLSAGDPAMTAGFYTPVASEMLWYLAIRTSTDPQTIAAPLRVAVANVDPDLQLQEVRTLEQAGQEERVFLTAVATGLTAMGGMALMLSIVGIYALLSFLVTRRRREIGIRIALGARNWQVLRSITGGAAAYLALGGVIGSALGIAFAQLRAVILISIPAPGLWMPATIFGALVVSGLIACWLPAHRALSIRPSEALNAD